MTDITIPSVPEDKSNQIGAQVELCVRQATDLKIGNQVDRDSAAVFVRGLKTILSKINDTFDKSIALANKTHKEMLAAKKLHCGPIQIAERIVKDRIGKYDLEQERIQRAEEARLRREQEERQHKVRVEEAERRRKLEEEEEARMAEAQRLEDEGKAEEAEAVLDAAPAETAPIVAEPMAILKLAIAPKTKGVSTTSVWKWEMVDESLIPREFLMVNTKVIDARVRTLKAGAKIPGIKPYETKQVAARAL